MMIELLDACEPTTTASDWEILTRTQRETRAKINEILEFIEVLDKDYYGDKEITGIREVGGSRVVFTKDSIYLQVDYGKMQADLSARLEKFEEHMKNTVRELVTGIKRDMEIKDELRP